VFNLPLEVITADNLKLISFKVSELSVVVDPKSKLD
jgi:hypothetical protein